MGCGGLIVITLLGGFIAGPVGAVIALLAVIAFAVSK